MSDTSFAERTPLSLDQPEVTPVAEQSVGNERSFWLGRDRRGHAVFRGDIVITPSGAIVPAGEAERTAGLPVLLLCARTLPELAAQLDLELVAEVQVQKQQEGQLDLNQIFDGLFPEEQRYLHFYAQDHNYVISMNKIQEGETAEWYVLDQDRPICWRDRFQLLLSRGRIQVHRLKAVPPGQQPIHNQAAVELLEEAFYPEYAAAQGRQYPQDAVETLTQLPALDYRRLTRLSPAAVMTQLHAGVARMAGDDPTIDRLQQQVSSEWESCLQRVNELRRADAAIIYAQGGIGDVPYQFQAARILAQTYPEKKLIFVCGSLFLPYFQSAAPANLEVVSSIELAGGTLVKASMWRF